MPAMTIMTAAAMMMTATVATVIATRVMTATAIVIGALSGFPFTDKAIKDQPEHGRKDHASRQVHRLNKQDKAGAKADRDHQGLVTQGGFADQPELTQVDPLEIDVRKTLLVIGPDIGWRFRSKIFFIAVVRGRIEMVELFGFRGSALCGIMVQLFAYRIAAEVHPVRFRKGQVQVPGLVNGIGRSDAFLADRTEENKFFVFFDDAEGIGFCPAILASQALGEFKGCLFVV